MLGGPISHGRMRSTTIGDWTGEDTIGLRLLCLHHFLYASRAATAIDIIRRARSYFGRCLFLGFFFFESAIGGCLWHNIREELEIVDSRNSGSFIYQVPGQRF